MADSTFAQQVLLVGAKRLGAALGLAAAIAFTRGFWEAAFEGFAESVGAGLGGVAIAVVLTFFSLVVVYMTLGSQIESVAVRLIALAAGNVDASLAEGRGGAATARADFVAAPIFAVGGLWLASAGVRASNAGWSMLGFSSLALAGLSLVSAVTHARFSRRKRGAAPEAALDTERTKKGGELAAIFTAVAVLSLTLSSAIFAASPKLRGGRELRVPRGDWVKLCVGEAPGCERSRLLAFAPDDGGAVLLEVVASRAGSLRARGRAAATDADGAPIRLARESGSELSWHARFVPVKGTTYELVLDAPGSYSVRWRSAP